MPILWTSPADLFTPPNYLLSSDTDKVLRPNISARWLRLLPAEKIVGILLMGTKDHSQPLASAVNTQLLVGFVRTPAPMNNDANIPARLCSAESI